jgi:N-acetyl-gamma-glutamyl-phosphate reductase
MFKVAVIGSTGYAGAELVRILSAHPQAKLTMITSRQYAGQLFSDVYPAMAGIVNLTCQSFSEGAVSEAADVVFTALPHKTSTEVVPGLVARGKKVVDLSADFRFKDPSIYEAWYEPHEAKDLLKTAVYGLPELYFDDIKNASLVGNPGCYPTSVLLPLLPIIKATFVDPDSIIADSKSGTSGAGRSVSLATHYCEVNEGFKAYNVAKHRHNPEIDEVLSLFCGRTIRTTFTPHLVPMTRGMLTTVYVALTEDVTIQDVASYLDSFYADKPFVRLCPQGGFPNTMHVKGTNYCDIGFQVATGTKRLILISAIDNLVKGASGQAVQNMNIMLGLPETAGLDQPPFPL